MATIAFIGLGIMGAPMAGHLLTAGHSLRIHSRTKSKANALLQRGATWKATPAAAAQGADFVFICVPDSPDVQKVITGPGGVIETAHAGQTIVDHSTISPAATRELAAQLKERSIDLLDAPVSGGDVGAKNATLTIMVGGEAFAFERAEPLLRHLGKTITYCGPAGNGQLTKAVNQILVAGTLMAVSEAIVFALKSGLNPRTTIETLGNGAAASWQLSNLGPRMASGDFRPGFMVDLLQKDLRIIIDAAEHSGTSLPASALVHQLLTAAQAAGSGREGSQALFKVLQNLSALH